jgi:hypothetical protein
MTTAIAIDQPRNGYAAPSRNLDPFRPSLTVRPSLHILQALQRPIFAEIDLFEFHSFMELIEINIRRTGEYRSISRFKLWEPLFSEYAAMEHDDLFTLLSALILEHSAQQLRWIRASVPSHSDPIIYTALPLALANSLLIQSERGPEFLFTTRWSLHSLPNLARQSILDEFLD